MSATRTVVRPGRRNGGTTLVFRLSRPAVLRITVVRVYPSCRTLGSFSVRGRAGVNRIRFRGRLGSRPLPAGGYRLIVRARGTSRVAAALPIVIARGPMSPAALHKARSASVCSEPIADFVAKDAVVAAGGGTGDERSGSVLGTIKERVKAPLASAAEAVAGTARGLSSRVRETTDDPLDNPIVLLTGVGAILLAAAGLAALLLPWIGRVTGLRGY